MNTKLKDAAEVFQVVQGKLPVRQGDVIYDAIEYGKRLEETIELIRKSTPDLDVRSLCEQALEYDYPNGVDPTPDPRQLEFF